jgi:hypothetical protein
MMLTTYGALALAFTFLGGFNPHTHARKNHELYAKTSKSKAHVSFEAWVQDKKAKYQDKGRVNFGSLHHHHPESDDDASNGNAIAMTLDYYDDKSQVALARRTHSNSNRNSNRNNKDEVFAEQTDEERFTSLVDKILKSVMGELHIDDDITCLVAGTTINSASVAVGRLLEEASSCRW